MNDALFTSPYISFFLATFVGLVLALLTWWLARKSGLVPAQERLIETLESNTKALSQQVIILREQLEEERKKHDELSLKHDALVARTDALEKHIANLSVENSNLRVKLNSTSRLKTREGHANPSI